MCCRTGQRKAYKGGVEKPSVQNNSINLKIAQQIAAQKNANYATKMTNQNWANRYKTM